MIAGNKRHIRVPRLAIDLRDLPRQVPELADAVGVLSPQLRNQRFRNCSAVDDILCREGDNRTIGLLLCKTKDRIKAEYALRDIQKPIGISDYELGRALPTDFRGSLPTIEEIEKELEGQ